MPWLNDYWTKKIMAGNAGLMEKINQDISTLERDTQAPTEEANAAALLNADWSGESG
jgi:hypothetical protein